MSCTSNLPVIIMLIIGMICREKDLISLDGLKDCSAGDEFLHFRFHCSIRFIGLVSRRIL